MNYFVGIDISKDTFNIAVLKDENFILSQTFPMSQEGFSQFLSLLNQLTNPIVVMESTGRFFLPSITSSSLMTSKPSSSTLKSSIASFNSSPQITPLSLIPKTLKSLHFLLTLTPDSLTLSHLTIT